MIFSEAVGAKPVLPVHNKWTDARLRLAECKELRRRKNVSLYLGATRAIRDTVINIYYWKESFEFMNLDELTQWIDLMPMEARNHPISIEVGLWGNAPAKTWAMANSLNIQHLTLVIHLNTSMNIPRQHINNLEFLEGKRAKHRIAFFYGSIPF